MKEITVTIQQHGDKEFISNSSIDITIDGKKVDNNLVEIVKKASQLEPFEVYDWHYHDGGKIKIEIEAPNGNKKIFDTGLKLECDTDSLNEKEIKDYFDRLTKFIRELESWTKENYSKTSTIILKY